jgi:hypothetical protein
VEHSPKVTYIKSEDGPSLALKLGEGPRGSILPVHECVCSRRACRGISPGMQARLLERVSFVELSAAAARLPPGAAIKVIALSSLAADVIFNGIKWDQYWDHGRCQERRTPTVGL